MKLSPHRLTPDLALTGICGLSGVGKRIAPPSPSRALPPAESLIKASPRAISGRTSYLHVRLAFHLYPQVIPQICNSGEFVPPPPVTAASHCPWIAHVVSGLQPPTSDALFRLAFAVA